MRKAPLAREANNRRWRVSTSTKAKTTRTMSVGNKTRRNSPLRPSRRRSIDSPPAPGLGLPGCSSIRHPLLGDREVAVLNAVEGVLATAVAERVGDLHLVEYPVGRAALERNQDCFLGSDHGFSHFPVVADQR